MFIENKAQIKHNHTQRQPTWPTINKQEHRQPLKSDLFIIVSPHANSLPNDKIYVNISGVWKTSLNTKENTNKTNLPLNQIR